MQEMDQSSTVPDPVNCENCKQKVFPDQRFCTACGFPVSGTAEEKERFYYRIGAKHLQLRDLDKKIKNARTTLWIVAGLTFVYSLFLFLFSYGEEAIPLTIANMVITILFLLLAHWAKQKPFTALLTGLILYVTLFFYNVIADQSALYRGILVRSIILIYLVKGVGSAREAEAIKKELNQV